MSALEDFANPTRLRRVAIAIIVVALVVGAMRELRPPTGMLISAEFNRAGLNIRSGDEVRVRGVPVGSVEAIEVDREDFSARYRLRIDPGVRVAEDTGARVVPKTLLGDKYVELDAAGPGDRALADGAHIPRERTTDVSELENVMDDLGVLVNRVDAEAFGATLASLAESLGDGRALKRTIRGFAAGSTVAAGREAEIRRMLADLPAATDAAADNADRFARLASDIADVTDVLVEHEPELAATLRANTELLERANTLVGDDRFERFVGDGLTILDITSQHPGAVEHYFTAFPTYVEGLAEATYIDTLYAHVPHPLLLGLPHVDSKDDATDEQGGRGPGTHIVFETPKYPQLVIDPTKPPRNGERGRLR